ncbi:uncharacterized protein ACIGJ3_003955 isoform 1-T1 [Trichechus inunguis]
MGRRTRNLRRGEEEKGRGEASEMHLLSPWNSSRKQEGWDETGNGPSSFNPGTPSLRNSNTGGSPDADADAETEFAESPHTSVTRVHSGICYPGITIISDHQ